MWFIVAVRGLLLSCFSRASSLWEGLMCRGWEGVGSGMFPGVGAFVSRVAAHISVTEKTGKRGRGQRKIYRK